MLLAEAVEVIGSRPHGHVQAVAWAMQQLGLASVPGSKPCGERDLVLAMIAARIVAPHTKLATTRWWHTTTLASDFGVADANEDAFGRTRRARGACNLGRSSEGDSAAIWKGTGLLAGKEEVPACASQLPPSPPGRGPLHRARMRAHPRLCLSPAKVPRQRRRTLVISPGDAGFVIDATGLAHLRVFLARAGVTPSLYEAKDAE